MDPKQLTTGLADALPTTATVDRAAQTAHDAIDRLAAKAGPLVEKLRTSASTAADGLSSRADNLGEMQDEWLDNARTTVRDNPLAAVAVGLLAGLLIGKLTR